MYIPHIYIYIYMFSDFCWGGLYTMQIRKNSRTWMTWMMEIHVK